METFAVTVFPVAKPDEWRAWVDSIATGDRADAHRQMMRRMGIKRESRSQRAMRAARAAACLTWHASSVNVRWCPPLSVAIVTHLVTQSLGGPCCRG